MNEQTPSPYKKMAITSWAEEDRPREKLMLKGKEALSNAELLAILIGSGSRKESAVDLSKRILAEAAKNDLNELGKKGVKYFIDNFTGIGQAKAISIVAALELGRRRRAAEVQQKQSITSSRDVFEIFQARLGDLSYEEFWILLLNRANKIIGQERISSGGVAGTVADPKVIFKKAIENTASGIIACHNHPSGNLKPSKQDRDLTRQLKEGAKLLDIQLLDHIIVSDTGYYSFADEGYL